VAIKFVIINYVDDLTESDNIAKLFAVKYRELCTSVPYNTADIHDIVSSLNTALHLSIHPLLPIQLFI